MTRPSVIGLLVQLPLMGVSGSRHGIVFALRRGSIRVHIEDVLDDVLDRRVLDCQVADRQLGEQAARCVGDLHFRHAQRQAHGGLFDDLGAVDDGRDTVVLCGENRRTRPASILSVVVLPAPVGPRRPTPSPGGMSKLIDFTASTSRVLR